MSKQKYTKEEIIEAYINLARKLGKLPTKREIFTRLGISNDPILRIFKTYENLKAEAIEAYPFLEELQIPVRVTEEDITSYRNSLLKKKNTKFNQEQNVNLSSLEYIQKFAERVFKGRVKGKAPKKTKEASRIVTLVISDTHFGSDIRAVETGFQNYGVTEEARRLAAVAKQAVSYKPEYRAKTKLELLIIGDLIQGQLHDARDGAPMAEQCCRAIHLLSQMIGYLSNHFPEISVRFQGGNHGRFTARHKVRAVNQKWDNIETVIIYGVKAACSNLKNVAFTIPKTPYGSYEVFGQRVWYSHGDTVIKSGYPGSSINVKSLETQMNKWNASLDNSAEYKVFIIGHVHTNSVTQLPNGCVLITNGALCPSDEYAVSIGMPESVSSQTIFESVPGHAVGDIRMIRVGAEDDKNIELDKIIKPWNNIN